MGEVQPPKTRTPGLETSPGVNPLRKAEAFRVVTDKPFHRWVALMALPEFLASRAYSRVDLTQEPTRGSNAPSLPFPCGPCWGPATGLQPCGFHPAARIPPQRIWRLSFLGVAALFSVSRVADLSATDKKIISRLTSKTKGIWRLLFHISVLGTIPRSTVENPPARYHHSRMRAVVQRVSWAKVTVDGQVVGRCEKGFLVFAGAHREDTDEDAAKLADRVVGLRIFNDDQGKMNLSLSQVEGSILAISNFTLYGDGMNNRRPSFIAAAPFAEGERLFETFVVEMRKRGAPVETGVFGAHMDVELENDGPVTLILDTREIK